MQLKGLVKILTIILVLICLYELSFTYFVGNYEKKIEEKAKKEMLAVHSGSSASEMKNFVADRKTQLLDSLGAQKVVYGVPYSKAKDRELKLGLDLQGGMNVVLEVGTSDLVANLAANSKEATLAAAIKDAVTKKANGNADFVTLFGESYKAQNPSGNLASIFMKPGATKINYKSTNEEVLAYIREESQAAIQNTYNVINKRIDKFGVSSPSISLDKNKGIISVELAGSQNPEKVRKLLQSAAKLEFWETYSNYEIVQNLKDADKALSSYLSGVKDSASIKGDSLISSKDTSNEAKIAKDRREHPMFVIMNPNNPRQDPSTGKLIEDPIMGYMMTSDTQKMNGYMAVEQVRNCFPKNFKMAYGVLQDAEAREKNPRLVVVYALKTVPGSDKPRLSGDQVDKAYPDYDQIGRPNINMSMKPVGATVWENMTAANIGKPIAIALDDMVYSAPAPSERIAGGRSQISGSFTAEETKDISNVLASGKIDAPARIVQEQVVGPTLGAENIKAGKNTFIIAFLVIFILMVVYYNTAGVVADLALILNLLFTIGILTSVGFSLTMAGIAGLVLTIGMAVDTNVIIFERIKEELSWGKNAGEAVNEGYRRSLAPILDGHITVFLTAFILFIFGLGPVLGFATTQMLGISLSLFCGILVSRMLTDVYMSSGKHLEYFTGLSKSVFKKFNFQFIAWRKYAYIISGIVLVLGIGSIFNGFKYGVEFQGGRSFTVKMDKAIKSEEVKKGLTTFFGGREPIVKTIGINGDKLNITTDYKIKETGLEIESEVADQLYKGMQAMGTAKAGLSIDDFKLKYVTTSQTVLPMISKELKDGAVKATIFSILIIFIYILIRFRKWQYSLGTVVALLHDVLVTLAVFSFLKNVVPFSLEIDQHFIAAILTVIGFSMNDTVIVFDRIREYFRKTPNGDKKEIINAAINDTLSRTIMTSLTVFLTILILFLFGGEATKGFAFAMLIGVITGTYSSIFVAAPILVDLDKSGTLSQEVDREAKIKDLKELA
jgi:SecD/SecF fusion protein